MHVKFEIVGDLCMIKKSVMLTEAGKKKIEDELDYLKIVKRVEIKTALKLLAHKET